MIPAKSYYRIMPGAQSVYADECFEGGFIGAGWFEDIDLTGQLPENVQAFNREFVPIYQEKHSGKSKVSAGAACGKLYTICKGIQIGDLVLSPNGNNFYFVGEVVSGYKYVPNANLPHQRSVKWCQELIDRNDMSQSLKNSTGSIATVCNITKHLEEIERLIAGQPGPEVIATDSDVEDPIVFALEKHLEEFLVKNWAFTELGKGYDIFEDEGEKVGQQYQTDTGPIDILAISKDEKELLVVELKKGRASDVVVGQIQRYMGYVIDELAEPDQQVKGVIIAMEDDLRLRRALRVTNNIEFYRYKVSFQLEKA